MDKYEERVRNAVSAIRSEREDSINGALAALNDLEVTELVQELCVSIEDVTSGKDVDRLLAAATLPLPDNPLTLVDAVDRKDITALHAYANGDFVTLLASMLALIASLQEAGDRI